MAKGQRVNRTGLADVFGVAMITVDGWVRDGCPVVERGGRGKQWVFNTADIACWLRDRAVADATGDMPSDEAELKRRKLAAETAKAELELAKARGDVAPIREYERAWSAMMANIRQNILNVPQRAVLQLLGETDESRFKERLRAELVLALEQAADADMELSDDEGEE